MRTLRREIKISVSLRDASRYVGTDVILQMTSRLRGVDGCSNRARGLTEPGYRGGR